METASKSSDVSCGQFTPAPTIINQHTQRRKKHTSHTQFTVRTQKGSRVSPSLTPCCSMSCLAVPGVCSRALLCSRGAGSAAFGGVGLVPLLLMLVVLVLAQTADLPPDCARCSAEEKLLFSPRSSSSLSSLIHASSSGHPSLFCPPRSTAKTVTCQKEKR
ncbi:hypothetical protein WMY93_008651 [Mugilogobius chulae]|uniref:Uncharacterized protein n=1 Tax=Mugilogobius chulae TaxID=88201 RepID=A0AAW0PGU2_9GOBI